MLSGASLGHMWPGTARRIRFPEVWQYPGRIERGCTPKGVALHPVRTTGELPLCATTCGRFIGTEQYSEGRKVKVRRVQGIGSVEHDTG